MPELPEVETVVRDIRPLVVGRAIRAIDVSRQALRRAWSPAWNNVIVGRKITSVERRGKWIFLTLDSGRFAVVHLGMTGQLTVQPADRPRESHTHVVLDLSGEPDTLRFRDIRRFGSVTLADAGATINSYLDAMGLGPEPFDLQTAYWREQLGRTRRCLKAILLDQRVVAGVGNIYADESLFAARLHPTRLGHELSAREVGRLRDKVPEVLKRAIDRRGSTIRNYVGGSGLEGGFQDEFCVYGRFGEPCVTCGTAIERIRLAGRATHFCPRCQKD